MTSQKSIKLKRLSPFRYPGGKAFLSAYIGEKLADLGSENIEYAEPYAGGAGAAIKLLGEDRVGKIRINDADYRVYSAWYAMLNENDRFLDRLEGCSIDITTWNEMANIVKNPSSASSPFDLGFATFFLNRTNRSGIIIGAGPIGGYEQKGEWTIAARFNRKTLIERIAWIGKKAPRIKLTNLDGLAFLKRASGTQYSERTMFFVDPPYVGAGGRLYMNGMTERKHWELATFLTKGSLKHWIVTYDDCPLISGAYHLAKQTSLDVVYSLQRKRTQAELLITPH